MRLPPLSPIPFGELEQEFKSSFQRPSFRRTVHLVVAVIRFSRGLHPDHATDGASSGGSRWFKRHSTMGNALTEPITDKRSACQANQQQIVGSSCMQGWRNTMEDAHVHILDYTGNADDGMEPSSYFAVFDGHFNGAVAEFCGENLHTRIKENSNFKAGHVQEAMRESCMALDAEILDDPPNFRRSGSTGVIVINRSNSLYCANVGDSRAVASVSGRAVPLSFDHKPYRPDEEKRIVAAGGFVHANRVNGTLAVSRGFGDSELKEKRNLPPEEQMVTANPEITCEPLTENHEFFILACDGIWDCKSSQEVVTFVRQRIAQKMLPDEICEELMMSCLANETRRDGLGCDNMTVVLTILLNGKTYAEAAALCERPCSPSVEMHSATEAGEIGENGETPMEEDTSCEERTDAGAGNASHATGPETDGDDPMS